LLSAVGTQLERIKEKIGLNYPVLLIFDEIGTKRDPTMIPDETGRFLAALTLIAP
jgi:hypothetical protein